MHVHQLTRAKPDGFGGRAWRRIVFFKNGVITERWPSGHECPYTPSQEDMLATDWEIVRND